MDQVNQKALEELQEYKKKGCHMLVPCMDHIADVANGFRLIVTPVLLRQHPRDKDVYPHDAKEYDYKAGDWNKESKTGNELVRLHGQAKEKLAQIANVIWDQPVVEIDRTNKGRQLCHISGALRMPDGFSFYRVPDLYGMDLDIVREQIIANYSFNGKFEEKKQWMVDRDFLQKKTNQTKLCITGAKNRVTEKILGLDRTYTVASLAKEFVAVRVIPWLDMNDKFTRELVIRSNVAQLAIANIFGGKPPAQAEQPAIEYVGDIDPAKCGGDDIVDIGENGNHHYALDEKPPEPNPQLTDFKNSSNSDQLLILTKLAYKKAYDLAWYQEKAKKTLGSMKAETLEGLFQHLVSLPDPVEEDVPFAMGG